MNLFEDGKKMFKSFFSSTGTKRERTKTGFLKKDLETLKHFGRTQASAGAIEGTAKRLKGAIKQQTGRERFSDESKKFESISGPGFGSISDTGTDEEIEKLFNLFQKREASISKRRKTPGIKQTRLVDR